MSDNSSILPILFDGWQNYQSLLVVVLGDLTPEQLALRPAPGLRSIGLTAAHIIGARARWFRSVLRVSGSDFESLGTWDRPAQPLRSAPELVSGLAASWQGMHAA